MARLEIFGAEGRERVELGDQPVTMGRADDVDLTIADQSVSRVHARLVPIASRWAIEDLGSKNGTWVEGERVYGQKMLQSGNELKLAGSTLIFRDDDADKGSSTVKKDPPPAVTPKEREVLVELCRPLFAPGVVKRAATVREIADAMFVGEPAVKQHLGHLYDKFLIPEGGRNRRDLLAEAAIETGVVRRGDYENGSS